MERRVEMKEPTWVQTMTQNGNGQGIQFFAASDQFSTRSCARCAGLLVHDWCYDLINIGEHYAEIFRCVQCGHRVDPVILRNQVRPPAKSAGAVRTQQHGSASTSMSDEAA
jgi:hypothetical protein